MLLALVALSGIWQQRPDGHDEVKIPIAAPRPQAAVLQLLLSQADGALRPRFMRTQAMQLARTIDQSREQLQGLNVRTTLEPIRKQAEPLATELGATAHRLKDSPSPPMAMAAAWQRPHATPARRWSRRSALLSEAFSRGLSKMRSSHASSGFTFSSFEQMGETLNRHVFSDGTALPTPFEELRNRHMQRRGARLRSSADSTRAGFDSKAEIVKTDDGTLASKNSLPKQSGKQAAKDAGVTMDNVKDVVKGWLKK